MNIELKVLNKEFYSGKDDDSVVGFDLPAYATPGSAAVDLICTEDITIAPGETKMIPTGLAIWIGARTKDVVGLILPRSGLGNKGLILANTIGVIDEDYQGELMVSVWNRNNTVGWEDIYVDEQDKSMWLGREPYRLVYGTMVLKAGLRFAQLMFMPVIKPQWSIVDGFTDNTARGAGGFGSTGTIDKSKKNCS